MQFFLTANGVPVHVSDSEKGDKVLLFLHGYLETLYIWEEFRDSLSSDFRTIAIDLPGHGLSISHPTCNDMHFYADIISDLLVKLKINSCTIIGHSMGGYIGQACLKYHPELFCSLVHFNSNPYADDIAKASERNKEINFIEDGRLMQLASLAIPNMYASANLRSCDNKIQETIELCETHDPFGVSAVVRGLMAREDNVDFLCSCTVPILFVFGDSDHYLPLSKAKKILDDIPNAKGAFIPESGHNSFIEHPAEVSEELLKFLSALP